MKKEACKGGGGREGEREGERERKLRRGGGRERVKERVGRERETEREGGRKRERYVRTCSTMCGIFALLYRSTYTNLNWKREYMFDNLVNASVACTHHVH